jgi:hypothetical protein
MKKMTQIQLKVVIESESGNKVVLHINSIEISIKKHRKLYKGA